MSKLREELEALYDRVSLTEETRATLEKHGITPPPAWVEKLKNGK